MAFAKGQPLSAYTVPELIDRTFRIYRENFVDFLTPVAIVAVPVNIISWFVSTAYNDQVMRINARSSMMTDDAMLAAILGAFVPLVLVAIASIVLQGIIMTGVLTHMTSEANLGFRARFGASWRAVRGRMVDLGVGLFLLYLIMVMGVFLIFWLTALCVIGVLGIGFLTYLSIAIYALIVPVYIFEKPDVTKGLNRAWQLGKARFWRVFWLIVIVGLINGVLSFTLVISQQLLAEQTIGSASVTIADIVSLVISTVIAVFIFPIQPIALTLMYFDTRVRLEGLDIAYAPSEDEPDTRPSDIEPPISQKRFMENTDWRNIAILTGMYIVIGMVGFALVQLLNPTGFSSF